MGFFDESSSEEEEAEKKQSKSAVLEKNDGKDEDVDPLDAYMNSLNEQQPQEEGATTTKPTSSRLDLDNEEEEAESHWHEKTVISSWNQDVDNDADEGYSYATREAKQALESTFHKAGKSDSKKPAEPPPPIVFPTDPIPKNFWTVSDTERGRKWRREHHVSISSGIGRHHADKRGIGSTGKSASTSTTLMVDPIQSFDELADVFGSSLLHQIQSVNHYTQPTLVQSQTLPVALSGRDAIVTAATGQGKTLAYVWPLAVHVVHQKPLQQYPQETGPIGLVLVPTRELALQVQKQAQPVLQAMRSRENKNKNNNNNNTNHLSCRAVIGGQGKYLLRQELQRKGGVAVVIATPGRLLDVVSERSNKGLSLQRVSFLVLDEGDKMLHMGFEKQVRQILQNIRPDRQTLLLSATMGKRIEKVASEWLAHDAIRIAVGRTGEASQNVEQHVMVLPNEAAKDAFLVEMLPVLSRVGRTLVFVATREGCERLATLARERIIIANSTSTDAPPVAIQTLHGDKHQSDRNAAVRAFTRGQISVLIATDVASRGLDIPNVQTVLSFDPAKNLDSHVHRVGRAGRLSKETKEQQVGSAYTLLTAKDADFAHVLRNAFEREGRAISPELEELAQKSRRAGNVASRSKANKAGLGFHDSKDVHSSTSQHYHSATSRNSNTPTNLQSVAGAPPAKRSRWS